MKRLLSVLVLASALLAPLGGVTAQDKTAVDNPSSTEKQSHTRVAKADPFSALVGKRERSPREARRVVSGVQRYVTATTERVFLFEVYGDNARIKFLCTDGDTRIDCLIDDASPAEEIYLLTGNRAPRGDTIYKDAAGRQVVRMTAYGGPTVFWPGEARGFAASKSFGDDAPLSLFPASLEIADARARMATALLSARLGAPVEFIVNNPGVDEVKGAAVVADAIARAAKALDIAASDPLQAKRIARGVRRVEFTQAEKADVELNNGVLLVLYNPSRDVHGRPSSAMMAELIAASF